MSFFSRKSAASSSTTPAGSTTDAKFGPATSDLLSEPVEGAKPGKKWTYDAEQLKLIAELQEYTKTLILPNTDAYYPWEARFLADPGTHPRFMRAAKWKMDDAKRRIKGTVEWRREFKPELIQPGDVGVEAETGKIILTGFDEDARPVLYLRPGRENTKPSPRQIRHMIYFLERAIDLMPPGQEQVCIIVDYKSATSGSMPSISTGRQVLSILQNHYVERMGRGLVVNMPWWMNAFFAGISPLMDPITRDKIRFNPTLTELVPGPHLDKEFGGTLNFEYDYKTYWPQLTKFCHLAEDGTRVTSTGETFYPPAGNGIAAAAAGILPKAGAVTSGETTTEPAESVQPGGIKTPASFGGASGPAGTPTPGSSVNGTAPLPASADEAKVETLASGETGLEESVQKLDVAEPPAVETKPGEPQGEVVFDHPPTEAEKTEAAALAKA